MECCLFFIVIIIISALSKGNTQKSNSSSNDVANLEDIFNEITKKTGRDIANLPSNSLPTPSMPVQQPRRRNKRTAIERASGGNANLSINSLTTPTSHVNHDCEAVNYDNLGSLEGGTGSFNLGEPEPSVVEIQPTKIKIGREELLKSFIISEVMQKYDINRIYSRIPSIKSDD